MVITPRAIAEQLAQPNTPDDLLRTASHMRFKLRRPFLDVVEASKLGQIPAAVTFARLLNEQYGTRLILAARLGELFTPIYSGLVLGAGNHIVANFKLLSQYQFADVTLETAEITADRIERYSRTREEFARLAFEELRVAAGFDREARVHEIALDRPALVEDFERIMTEMRAMLTIYDPGRPTWLLVHMTGTRDFTPQQMDILRSMPGGVIDRVLVLQPTRVMIMRNGRSNVISHDCTPNLVGHEL